MAYSNKESSSKSEVPILTIIDLTTSQYKKTVEDISVEMVSIHTSLLIKNEEITRLASVNEKLIKKNEELELFLVGLEGLKKDNEYLKEKLNHTEQVEKVLRIKFDENELNLKSYKNSTNLVTSYHDLHTENQKFVVGLDYNAHVPKKVGTGIQNKNAYHILINIKKPLFKACTVDFGKEALVIKQQLYEEDQEKKSEQT